MIIDTCLQGKPKKLIVRKDTIEWIVREFCKKTGIKLVVKDNLYELDEVMEHMEIEFG
ncbi:DUF6930 domain-containing protein [Marinilactibacillus sp. GCM10026970]|uniref:DUF6930 domain-containing protein n=1 Tax=Marinilactibacillus sp. GCM10026970 TaxID=3252642 RepID=UPI003613982D